ncbi:MAG TPA: DUF1499 domain-containing protein [Burkholderiales bacterium]|nr:DUF1499 domain-containing protein [Burkholderiales bacterium]
MLKRVLLAVILLLVGATAGIALHTSLTRGNTMFAGKRPTNLGLHDGRLAPCRRSPNCVSSQADAADTVHRVAPIPFKGAPVEAMAAVRRAVESMPRATVVRHEPDYLYAQFRSRLLGFVDDVEFAYDEKAGAIQVRSASRLGRRDFGANRARVEAIRALILHRVSA